MPQSNYKPNSLAQSMANNNSNAFHNDVSITESQDSGINVLQK